MVSNKAQESVYGDEIAPTKGPVESWNIKRLQSVLLVIEVKNIEAI